MKLLLDLNVVLDVLLDRKPHAHTSARLWAAVEEGRVNGLIAAHSVTTLYYLAHRARGRASPSRRSTIS